jgi:hypothetical protein
MAASILETNNYSKFELLGFNRDVNKTRFLEMSMIKHGWIDAYPAHVMRNPKTGKLQIKAGHHRFIVAQKLRIPIKYVECRDEATIHELERATTPWTLKDYLTSFVRLEKPDYIQVLRYHKETGINLAACVSMLAGNSAGSSNWHKQFKDGTYRLGDPTHAKIVGDIVLSSKKSGFAYASARLFIEALSKVVWAEGFSPDLLKKKISRYVEHMKKQPSKQAYVEMLDSIYNRGSKNKIPLAFLAEEAARKRNVVPSSNESLLASNQLS